MIATQVFCAMMMIMVKVELSQSAKEIQQDRLLSVTKRSTTLTRNCTKDNEGEIVYNPDDPLTSVWLCKNSWTQYQLVPSAGKAKEFSAHNCKEIKTNVSGVYWVQNQQIYCDMNIDDGGWTLVWKHTYMKYKPLHSGMFYYSKSYQPCIKNASYEDWCNIPNKARFDPTEQMIVAYHKGKIVFAYKGNFNYNIDKQWDGAVLHNPKKLVDKCIYSPGTPPAPSVHYSGIFGLTFDKVSPDQYLVNCNTYHQGSTLTSQKDCRWHDCHLRNNISSKAYSTDMTMAIFVR